MTWPKELIQKISTKIKNGLKFFVNHSEETNSHENRKSVGEVVGSFVKNIGNKLSNIVIGYFQDADLVEKMDINSMEADISINENTGVVTDMKEMTGIALGSSEINSPAFPGAVRLTSIQCFGIEDKKTLGDEGGQEMAVTFDEVKAFVKSNHVYPHQLFDDDMMKSDREFGKLYTENTELKTKNETLQKDFDAYKQKSDEAIKESERINSKALLKKLMPEGLTKKQTTFIEENFDPEKFDDLSESGLKGYIENSTKEFAKMAKIFGTETSTEASTETEESEENSGSIDAVDDAVNSIIGAK